MKKLDLNGKWTFHEVGRSKWLKATVPGNNYKDLVECGEIIHPYKDSNNSKVQWVGERNWEYAREFNLSNDFLLAPQILLVCEGLDTLAEIYINDKLLAKTENSFRRYKFNIKSFVSRLTNTIRIRFRSPIQYIDNMLDKEPLYTSKDYYEGCNYMRKPVFHFGSYGFPMLPLCGITGNIYIESHSELRLSNIVFNQAHSNDSVKLTTKINIKGCLNIDDKDSRVAVMLSICSPSGKKTNNSVDIVGDYVEIETIIDEPRIWRTHDIDEEDFQPLYFIKATLLVNDEEVDTATRNIGLRTIELARSKDEYGKQFQFLLNGEPIYIKGAVLSPQDILDECKTLSNIKVFVDNLVDANINLVRVTGKAGYIKDTFLNEFDKRGILVWQDLPFVACEYPFNKKEFKKNITQEIKSILVDMSSHPSLALVCGSYELEYSINRSKIKLSNKREIVEFFYDYLPNLISEVDVSIPYIPSTPCSTKPFDKPNSAKDGDSHLWKIWLGISRMSKLSKSTPRFCSEFGMASFCDYNTLVAYNTGKQLQLNSEYIDSRQTEENSLSKAIYYLAQYFRVPKNIEYLIYFSGLTQAEYYKNMVLHLRTNRRKNSGVILHSINSKYPGINMSSIDFGNTFKPLMYKMRSFYAPIAITLSHKKGHIKTYIINDYNMEIRGKYRASLLTYDGEELAMSEQSFSLSPSSVLKLPSIDLSENVKKSKNSKVLLMELFSEDDMLIGREIMLFVKNKKAHFKQPTLEMSVNVVKGYAFVTVKSDTLARFVKLTLDNSTAPFSDNYFDILAGEEITVSVAVDKMNSEDVLNNLHITSLANVDMKSSSYSYIFKNIGMALSLKNIKNHFLYKYFK